MTNIHIAYLILAHKHPDSVARLVDRINVPDTGVFIHVDKKVNIDPFREACRGQSGVTFADDREVVYWGGLSIVKATMKLLQMALHSRDGFTHFVLLSGSDYPIKPQHAVLDALKKQEKNYISITRNLSLESATNAVNRFHFKDVKWLNPTVEAKTVHDRLLRFVANRMVHHMGLAKCERRLPRHFTLYKGSQWWCLRREAAAYVLEFWQQERRIVKFHRFVHAPDEILIQSVLRNSRFADTISHDLGTGTCARHRNAHGIHYIDTSRGGRHPKTLEAEDFQSIQQSEALFARKFEHPASTTLIRKIDAELL